MPTVTTTTTTTTVKAVAEVARKAVELDAEGAALADELATLRMTRADIEKREKAIRDTLVGLIGEAEAGTVAGRVRVEVAPRVREGVDLGTLREAFPEAYEATRTATPYTVVVLR